MWFINQIWRQLHKRSSSNIQSYKDIGDCLNGWQSLDMLALACFENSLIAYDHTPYSAQKKKKKLLNSVKLSHIHSHDNVIF